MKCLCRGLYDKDKNVQQVLSHTNIHNEIENGFIYTYKPIPHTSLPTYSSYTAKTYHLLQIPDSTYVTKLYINN